MRRRKTFGVAAIGFVALIVAAAVALRSRQDRITLENYRRIRVGMSRTEVEAILGPPGNYSTGPKPLYGRDCEYWPEGSEQYWFESSPILRGPDELYEWATDTARVRVMFDDAGVRGAAYRPANTDDQGYFDNLPERAKRRWRDWFSK
jgi:hypothetical protein